MPWLELQLTVDAARQPRAEDALEGLGALAITLMDADADTPDEAAIFEPGVGETPLWHSITLTALFALETRRDTLVAALAAALPRLSPGAIGFREVADQDWTRAWMDRYHPMRFGRRLWIYPWNIEPPRNDGPSPAKGRGGEGVAPRATDPRTDEAVIVRLDPGLAFGTGTHPTTALCLTWLDGVDLAGKTIIDYGCGSGVLAIAALKLGAAHAIGIDNDPQARVATGDNARRNGVAARLEVLAPEALPSAAQVDVCVANILSGPLNALAPRVAALCRPGALLALSGILAGQDPELLSRYAACGFGDLGTTARDGWMRIDGVRRSAARTPRT
ncbi:MAG TPA: 50S ribosomal protein L11 methyltransferase [Rhodanobacteraceae bacterium]|nr:50S ribosomal protein L11 methyltransferase [Rhodanobacteraceae bacterium]